MKAILASDLGGCAIENGARVPAPLFESNGMLEKIKAIWPRSATVLLISADPEDFAANDLTLYCFKNAFKLSGLGVSKIAICDGRNPEAADEISKTDVLLFVGGHVPTQNKFMKAIRLKERLAGFGGVILALSAGSMNCAENVYSCPELEGEATDPNYNRRLSGLGITDVNILPHFQYFRGVELDGLRFVEDIALADSFGGEIIALNDGGYIYIDGEKTTVFGEAYSLKDGEISQICADGESFCLSRKG